jgi:uncharacterized membrane protein YgcG
MKVPLAILIIFFAFAPARAAEFPMAPGEWEIIADRAGVAVPTDVGAIRLLANNLRTERQCPLMIATIPSLAAMDAAGWTIERYAMTLHERWFGERERGILLLVSSGGGSSSGGSGNGASGSW